MIVYTKQCQSCDEFKLLTEFHKKPTGKHGRMARCAECVNAERRARKTNTNRSDVTLRIRRSLRDALNVEAANRDIPTSWLTDHLIAIGIRELRNGNVKLPDNPPRRRHRDAPNGR